MYKISKRFRPEGLRLKHLTPGITFPTGFLDDLHSIDPRLYIVFHPYRTETDPIVNQYTGELDDPRFCIGALPGDSKEIWGWALRDNNNQPIKENMYHIWELTTVGWGHVCRIETREPNYLHFLARRLYLQAKYKDKYGWRAWLKLLHTDQEKMNNKEKADVNDMMSCVYKENEWLTRSAMENMKSGKIVATRPKKDIIMSGAGINKRSRITRDITDKEGGLILPGDSGWTN